MSDSPVVDTTPAISRWSVDVMAFTLMLFFMLMAACLSVMPVVHGELADRFGFSASRIGLLTSVFMFAFGAVGIPAGVGAARWGGRMFALSAMAFAAGSLLFAFSSSYGLFLVARAVQGIGAGFVVPVSSPVLAHTVPSRHHARAWGIFGAGQGLGVLLTMLALSPISRAGGYRAVFITVAALAVVIGIAALAQKPVRSLPRHPEEATSLRGLGKALAAVAVNRKVLLLALFNAGGLAFIAGVPVWTPDFLHSTFGASAGFAAALTAGYGAACLLGNPAGAAVMTRWGKLTAILLGLATTTVVVVAVPFSPDVWVAFALVTISGFLSLLYFSANFGIIPEVVAKPEQVGPATGLINLLSLTAALLAPWLFGVALDAVGPSRGYIVGYLIFAAFGLAALAGIAFFYTARERRARRKATTGGGVTDPGN